MNLSELHKFIFEGLPVRGMLVRLDDAGKTCCAARVAGGLPGAGARAAGRRWRAAGVLMQANIKFDGALILQIIGDGPVKLAVAEVQPDLAFASPPRWWRGAARREARCACQRARQGPLRDHARPRRTPAAQPYQGVVRCTATSASRCSVSEVLEHYMLQSEQLGHAAHPRRQRRGRGRPC
jgi:molecular chaperone Hsp33